MEDQILTMDQIGTIAQAIYQISIGLDRSYVSGAMNAFRFLGAEGSAEELTFLLTFILLNGEEKAEQQPVQQTFADQFSPYGITSSQLWTYCRVLCTQVSPSQGEGLVSVLSL